MEHFATKKQLPKDSYVFPSRLSDRLFPLPDATPLGTYGRKKRLVYRRSDLRHAKSRTAWGKENRFILPDQEPVAEAWGQYCYYPIFCEWQTVGREEFDRIESERRKREKAEKIERERRLLANKEKAVAAYKALVSTDSPLMVHDSTGEARVFPIWFDQEHLADFDSDTGDIVIHNNRPGKITEAVQRFNEVEDLRSLCPVIRQCKVECQKVSLRSHDGESLAQYDIATGTFVYGDKAKKRLRVRDQKMKALAAYKSEVSTDRKLHGKEGEKSITIMHREERLATFDLATHRLAIFNRRPGAIQEAYNTYMRHPLYHIGFKRPVFHSCRVCNGVVELRTPKYLLARFNLETKQLDVMDPRLQHDTRIKHHQDGVNRIVSKYPWLKTGVASGEV